VRGDARPKVGDQLIQLTVTTRFDGSSLDHCGHCCIKASGVLAMIQSGKQAPRDPWKTMTNPASETS